MITAFEVGSVFRIVDQASPALRAMLKSAVALDKTTASIQKNLTAISGAKLAGVSTEFKAIASEAAVMNREVASSARSMTRLTQAGTGLGGVTAAISSMTGAVALLATQWQAVATQASTALAAQRSAGRLRLPPPGGARPPPLPGAGAGGGRGRGGFHLGRFGASVPVLGGHVHASAPSSAAGVAAGAGLFSIYELGKYGMEPAHQEAKLRLLGIPESLIAQMSGRARQIAVDVPGSGYAKNLSTMGELYSIVGAEGAMSIAPKLAEIDRVQSIVGGKGKDQGSAYVLTRATELMGKLTDPMTHHVDLDLFGKVIDTMSKISIATHGKVTPEEWLNYAKQAGPASGALTGEGLYTTAAIIQAMGGHRAGTAAAAIQRQFSGGKMTKSTALELLSLGIAKEGDFEFDHGKVVTKSTAMNDLVRQFQTDPLSAIVNTIAPALESHGFKTPEDQAREIYKFIGTGPAQREIYEMLRGREQIVQERNRAMGALAPTAALGSLGANDPEQVMGSLTTAFKDLLGAVGGPLAVASIPVMTALTNAFNRISQVANEYKTAAGVAGTTASGAAGGAALGFGIGWLGGPVGAGSGALIGAGAGAGYGLWNALPDSVRSGAASGAGLGFRTGIPGLGVAGGIAGGLWGGAYNLFSGADGGSIAQLGKNILMIAPPKQTVQVEPAKVTLNMDGKKVGEAVIAYAAREGQGPAQGSPAFDPTRGGTQFDFSLVN